MLDLETLDTGSNATIISIGACRFSESGVEEGSNFYQAVDTLGQVETWGRTVGIETQAWWNQQSPEAREVFGDPDRCMLDMALKRFSVWFREAGPQVLSGSARPADDAVVQAELWGNGADFDNIILGNAYEGVRQKKPWSYSKNRCFRTLKNLGIKLDAGAGIERKGHHNALADYAAAYLRRLNAQSTA